MATTTGSTSSQANPASERRSPPAPLLAMARGRRGLREGLLQRHQLLEALRHRGGAADDVVDHRDGLGVVLRVPRLLERVDRKSTRLNSSHMSISYAVFCLKKKKHAT